MIYQKNVFFKFYSGCMFDLSNTNLCFKTPMERPTVPHEPHGSHGRTDGRSDERADEWGGGEKDDGWGTGGYEEDWY